MKIIKPHFIIEDKIDGEQILRNLERYGRTCYKSEDKITPDSARKFIATILKSGHEGVEFFPFAESLVEFVPLGTHF